MGTEKPDLPTVQDLYDQAACGLLVTTADGLIRRVNATFCRWIGYAATDLIDRKRIQDLLSIGSRVFHQTHWAPLLQIQGSVSEVQLEFVDASGRKIPMLLNAVQRQHQGTGFHELAVLISSDRRKYEHELLAARKLAEESLAERLEAQRSLQKNRDVLGIAMAGAKMGVWSHDLPSGHVWMSQELEELLGLAPGEFAGTLDAFRQLLHETDREAIAHAIEQSTINATDYIVEFRMRQPDGSWKPMEGRGRTVYDQAGKPVSVFGILTDITERKAAETVLLRQAAIFEDQSDAIIVTNVQGMVIDANPGCQRMLGYPTNEIVGQHFTVFQPAEDAERIQREAVADLSRHSEWRGEIVFIRKDGTQGMCESVIKALTDSKGRISGMVSVNRDITQRRQAEAQLRQLNEQLYLADRRKDEFLATLAHELRNPLAPMRNVIEILKLKKLDDPQLAWSREVFERQVHYLTHLVDDLMEASRITQGRLELRKSPMDLAVAMRNAVEAVQPAVKVAGHRLHVDMPEHAVIIDADATRLVQMILNLLNNAVKYTPEGGEIWLKGGEFDGRVLISVRDSGIGIRQEQLARVFEMFSQLESALDRAQGGLGIGLALVRGLADLHGGTVTASSPGLGYGSEFVLTLPLSQHPQALVSQQPTVFIPGGGHRVLVIDDNVDITDSMAMVLELLGYEARAANDGLGGMIIAAEFKPHVILLDIGLPVLNGYEIAKRIRNQSWGKDVALIAVTGWGQAQDKQTAKDAGFDNHLTKPVDFDQLDQMLRTSIQAHI